MKYLKLLGLLAVACCLAACSAPLQDQNYLQQYGYQGGRGQGYRMLPYRGSHEVHACVQERLNGRITRLQAETLSLNMEPGLGMDIQTPDQGLVHVHLGPLWLLDRRQNDLKPGDEVAIKVFCYTSEGQERLLAGEVTHKGNTLVLRDPQGVPYWEAWRKQ